MRQSVDLLTVYLLRIAFAALNALPLALRLRFVSCGIRIFSVIVPRHRRVAEANLVRAFPNQSPEWRTEILHRSVDSLARTIVDFARLGSLDAAWVHEHVECPFLERFREIKRLHPGKGIMIATGHLGSFELLAHCAAIYGHPLSFVVRNSKLPRVDAWWREARERNGNRVISRKGAFKEIAKNLGDGVDVGVLFDQNVTINHAVFVPWFGTDAATTKTVALAAIRSEAPVIVAGVIYLGGERYRIEARDFDFSSIYHSDVSVDEKVREITAQLSAGFEQLIRLSPHEWFWMHRRWKTRPPVEKQPHVEKEN